MQRQPLMANARAIHSLIAGAEQRAGSEHVVGDQADLSEEAARGHLLVEMSTRVCV